jgi:hypothetical protein
MKRILVCFEAPFAGGGGQLVGDAYFTVSSLSREALETVRAEVNVSLKDEAAKVGRVAGNATFRSVIVLDE